MMYTFNIQRSLNKCELECLKLVLQICLTARFKALSIQETESLLSIINVYSYHTLRVHSYFKQILNMLNACNDKLTLCFIRPQNTYRYIVDCVNKVYSYHTLLLHTMISIHYRLYYQKLLQCRYRKLEIYFSFHNKCILTSHVTSTLIF